MPTTEQKSTAQTPPAGYARGTCNRCGDKFTYRLSEFGKQYVCDPCLEAS